MSTYELVDNGFNLQHDDIYEAFVEYFENPKMYKIKDVGQYSLYASKIQAFLGIEHRYVMVIVIRDDRKSDVLRNLRWVSIQTRSIEEDHKLPYHTYVPKRSKYMTKTITRIRTPNKNEYKYNVDGSPLIVELLPNLTKKDENQYSNTGILANALETFNTVVQF
jgi:hypothetical protein